MNFKYSSLLGALSVFTLSSAVFGGFSAAHAQSMVPAPSFDQIVGGNEVESDDPIAATTVALQGHDSEGSYLCTGSIIAEDLVVTAGHCLPDNATSVTILFRRDMHGVGTQAKTDGGVRPTEYNDRVPEETEHFDIALLHFKGGLPEGYQPVKLLDDASDLHDGAEVTLAGYGNTQGEGYFGVAATHGTLRKTQVSIAHAHFNAGEFETDESHGKGSCNGDSGGPALLETSEGLVLAGLTSRGDPSCSESGIYTLLPAFKSWLAKSAAQLRAHQ